MKRKRENLLLRNPFFGKNWERNVSQVSVEPCDRQEDPLGYRAIFFMRGGEKSPDAVTTETFVIGASYLALRKHNLIRAGYKAPMTHRAIDLIEQKLGARLPVVLA